VILDAQDANRFLRSHLRTSPLSGLNGIGNSIQRPAKTQGDRVYVPPRASQFCLKSNSNSRKHCVNPRRRNKRSGQRREHYSRSEIM
jgi:hypothetical protein